MENAIDFLAGAGPEEFHAPAESGKICGKEQGVVHAYHGYCRSWRALGNGIFLVSFRAAPAGLQGLLDEQRQMIQ
jgi:hypothetical protein